MYITLDLVTVLVATGSLTIGWLVYRWAAPPASATTPSKGERLLCALTATAAAIAIGGYLGNGIQGIERTPDPQQEPVTVETGIPGPSR